MIAGSPCGRETRSDEEALSSRPATAGAGDNAGGRCLRSA